MATLYPRVLYNQCNGENFKLQRETLIRLQAQVHVVGDPLAVHQNTAIILPNQKRP